MEKIGESGWNRAQVKSEHLVSGFWFLLFPSTINHQPSTINHQLFNPLPDPL